MLSNKYRNLTIDEEEKIHNSVFKFCFFTYQKNKPTETTGITEDKFKILDSKLKPRIPQRPRKKLLTLNKTTEAAEATENNSKFVTRN
jgi:hypothetical protein